MTPRIPIDALVLCGGLGTRLKTALPDTQKTMAPVRQRPFLDFVLDWLERQGIERAILCAGYRADDVKAHFGERKGALRLLYSVEDAPLGTGGAAARGAQQALSATLLVVNGDSLCPADLAPLVRAHSSARASATVLTTRPDERRDCGFVTSDEAGKVLSFSEKTPQPSGRVNAGVYLIERKILQSIPPDTPSSLENELFPSLVGRGLYAFAVDVPLVDIGTPERLRTFRERF